MGDCEGDMRTSCQSECLLRPQFKLGAKSQNSSGPPDKTMVSGRGVSAPTDLVLGVNRGSLGNVREEYFTVEDTALDEDSLNRASSPSYGSWYATYFKLRRASAMIGASAVAIDNKIEQAMDLVKTHLIFAVREEVDQLKAEISLLSQRNAQLQAENYLLRSAIPQETLANLPLENNLSASSNCNNEQ